MSEFSSEAERREALGLGGGKPRTRYPDIRADLGDLSGPDGNVFAVIGHVAIALAPLGEAVVSEMTEDLFSSESYDEALAKVRQWVTIT